jgi:hypothetical protein
MALISLFIALSAFTTIAAEPQVPGNKIYFILAYETNKPIDLQKATLFYSQNSLISKKADSVSISFNSLQSIPDTIFFKNVPHNEGSLRLKLSFKDRSITSNPFYWLKDIDSYLVAVNDNQIKIHPKLARSDDPGRNSIRGIALIMQAILEMIIALLISKIFGLSRYVILMVLVANIAAFPLNLTHFYSALIKEALIFATKAIVMLLIGMRKMPKWKILVLLLSITIIGLGFKELFFFLAKIF